MCGIAGFDGQGGQETIRKMTSSLKHRGPDDQGFFNSYDLYLGFRRLSIIDLSSGQQPITNEDGSIWVIFNGEIYNFLDLKSELEKAGHIFKTKADTEVIVHAYEEYGEDFLTKLNGMFALSVWDENNKKLIVARDRMGQKPLYYSVVDGSFIFASEMKAMMTHPLIKKEIDLSSLGKYLTYEYVPAPASIIKGVNKLEPGHYLVWQDNRLEKKQYFDMDFDRPDVKGDNLSAALDEFENLLEDSVKKRLVSDVPLGIFLSGGIDSSAISYYAAKHSEQKIKTFSIGFDDKSFDESGYADQVSKHLNTEHYHHNFTPTDLISAMSDIASINDEPFADASTLPTHLLSKFTKEKVTVALSGDGGDELLAGYPTFQAMRLAKVIRLLPNVLIKTISKLINLLPVSLDNFSLDFKLKRLFSGYEYIPEIQNQIWLGSFTPEECKKLLNGNHIDPSSGQHFSELRSLVKNVKDESLENRLLYLYQKQYLGDDILVKADRTSMHNSLEVRAPFLDHRLVDYINSLPYKFKLKGFTTKYILKELMKGKLPDNIINRPKKGFGIPIGKWINGELRGYVDTLLNQDRIKEQGIFNYRYVNNLIDEHRCGKADHRKKIWTLLMFQEWHDKWMKEEEKNEAQE